MTLIERMQESPMTAVEIYHFDQPTAWVKTPWHYGTARVRKLANQGYPIYDLGDARFGVLKSVERPVLRKLKDSRWPGEPLCRIPDTNGIDGSWMLP